MVLSTTNKICMTLLIVSTVTVLLFISPVQAQPTSMASKLVHAGGGNATSVVVNFVPQQIEIKAGESITWDNPTTVAEPHSVTFMKDKKFFADFVLHLMFQIRRSFSPLNPILILNQS